MRRVAGFWGKLFSKKWRLAGFGGFLGVIWRVFGVFSNEKKIFIDKNLV